MTNRTTKRALITSAVALVLCFTMLLGTTYAWFTDSAATAVNTIVSGNLDVVLEYKTNWNDPWTPVTPATKLFKEGALYEPGYTEVVFLRISNAGNLAFKYNLNVNVYGETPSTNVDGQTFKLSDYLEIGYYVQDEYSSGFNYANILMPGMFGTAAAAISNVKQMTKLSETTDFVAQDAPILVGEQYSMVAAIVLTMPTTVGNEANHKTGVAAPTIDLGVTLVATQNSVESEKDSFGSDYDKDANLADVKFEKYIKLEADSDEALEIGEKEAVKLDMGDNKLTSAINNKGTLTAENGEIDLSGDSKPYLHNYGDATFNDVDMKAGDGKNYCTFLNKGSVTEYNNTNIITAGGGIVVRDGAKAVFNNGGLEIASAETGQRYVFYVYGEGTELTINGGEFSFEAYKKRGYIYASDNAIITITGGTFGPASNHPTDPTAPIILDGNAKVIITGGTFGFDPTKWVADGYEAVPSNGVWTVQAK